MKKEILRIERAIIEKEHIIQLDDLSLWVCEGEILGIIAINQHGLNPLVELIMENIPLKYGKVYFEGELVNDNIREWRRNNKVCMIDNHARLVPGLTVADNIFILRKGFKKYVISEKVIEKQVQQILGNLEISVRADALAGSLSEFERCVIELLKAVTSGIKFIIIRDISTIISYADLKIFFDLIKYYQRKGITFLYIGNHHEDVFEISQRAAIYRDGRILKFLYSEDMDEAHIDPFIQTIKKPIPLRKNISEWIVKIHQVSTDKLRNFSCEVFPGECLTVLDKNHSILYDIKDIITGKMDVSSGDIYFEGITRKNEKTPIENDIMVIPEDPLHRYLFMEQSYLYNFCFQIDQKIDKAIIPANIKKSIMKEWEEEIGKNIDTQVIRELPVEELYDLLYYRILLYHPKIAILIQPFLGADMYLRIHIADLIHKLKERNIAVVILTSYMADTLAITDHMILIEEGKSVPQKSMLDSQWIKNNYYKNRYLEKTTNEIPPFSNGAPLS